MHRKRKITMMKNDSNWTEFPLCKQRKTRWRCWRSNIKIRVIHRHENGDRQYLPLLLIALVQLDRLLVQAEKPPSAGVAVLIS